MRQEFLVMIVEEELEDHSLESFTDILWVISDVGFREPKSVNKHNGGKGNKQGLHGLVD